MISAIGVQDARIVWGHSSSEHTIDRPILELPPFQLISLDDDMRQIAKPAFDALWQAGGQARSPSYDQSGAWNRS
jgi:hypothetical protein